MICTQLSHARGLSTWLRSSILCQHAVVARGELCVRQRTQSSCWSLRLGGRAAKKHSRWAPNCLRMTALQGGFVHVYRLQHPYGHIAVRLDPARVHKSACSTSA